MKTSVVLRAGVCLLVAGCDRSSKPAVIDEPPATKPAPTALAVEAPEAQKPAEKVLIPEVPIAASGASKVHVTWKLPPGTGVNEGAPFRVRWKSSEGLAKVPDEMRATGADVQRGFDVDVTPTEGSVHARLAGNVDVVVCDTATHRVCVPIKRQNEMNFDVMGTSHAATIAVPLPEAK